MIWNPVIVTIWMYLEGIMLSEITQRERQIQNDFTHIQNLNKRSGKKQTNLWIERSDQWLSEQRGGYSGGEIGEGGQLYGDR